jgi:hypothetical protein
LTCTEDDRVTPVHLSHAIADKVNGASHARARLTLARGAELMAHCYARRADKPEPAMPPQPIPSPTVASQSARSINLEGYLEQTVVNFCGKYGSVGDAFNHCAHFVSHVLSLRIPGAALCSNVGDSTYTYAERAQGYCVRVNQVFNSCQGRARWSDDDLDGSCLIIATIEANIESQSPITIGQMSTKHIGFHVSGQVYHYSNREDKVIKQAVGEFRNHYGARTVLLRCDLP